MSALRITLSNGTVELPQERVVAWLQSKIYNGFAGLEVGTATEKPHLHVILDGASPDPVRTLWGRAFPDHRGNGWISVKAIKDDGARAYAAKDGRIVWSRGYTAEALTAFTVAGARARNARAADPKTDFVSECLELCRRRGRVTREEIAGVVLDAKLERGGVVQIAYLRGVMNAIWCHLDPAAKAVCTAEMLRFV